MFGFCDMGGIYRSVDGGRNWRMYTAHEVQFPVAYSPTHCRPAFHPTNENIAFIGASDGLTGRTTAARRGRTSHSRARRPTAVAIYRDRPDRTCSTATSGNRLYRSDRRRRARGLKSAAWYTTVNRTITDIFVDASTPSSNLTIYASTYTGPLYKSTDGGADVGYVHHGDLPAGTIYDFNGGMKGGSAVLYVAIASNGVYKSTDGGATLDREE